MGKSNDAIQLKMYIIKKLYILGTTKNMPELLDEIWINGGSRFAKWDSMSCGVDIYGNILEVKQIIKGAIYCGPDKPNSYAKSKGAPLSVREWVEYLPELKAEIRNEKIDTVCKPPTSSE